MSSKKVPKVAIIGAGVSGIAAAEKLQQLGITNYTILEATGRIGGRIRTHYATDREGNPYKLELGAQWVHGTHNNPVHEIAKKHGLYKPLQDTVPPDMVRRHGLLNRTEHGEIVPDLLHRTIMKQYFLENELCGNYFRDGLPSGLLRDISIEEKIRTAMMPIIAGFEGHERELAQNVLESLLAYETGISGCDSMSQVSLQQFGSYEELGGQQPTVHQGYSQVVSMLARDIPEDRLLLGHAVQCIDWQHKQNARVILTCNTGAVFEVDCVIVTASLGHLKAHSKQLFLPSLPEKKQKAIDTLGIDAVDKIFLRYDSFDFLPHGVGRIHIARSQESISTATGPQWIDKIQSFHVVKDAREKILVCWITGRAAESMERLSSQDVGIGCTRVLRSVLNNPNVPLPVEIIRTDWYNNQFTRGSYTYIPVGATVDHVWHLAQPVDNEKGEPVLLFAGEATHPKYYSSVHGALLTGRTAAERIAEAYASK